MAALILPRVANFRIRNVANTERNLIRQRELFLQKFISQSALDTAINQADVLKGQLAVDEAAAEASRVSRSFTQIRAPFAGRTGAISVRVGSLVQPSTQNTEHASAGHDQPDRSDRRN